MAVDLDDPRIRDAQFGRQVELWLDTDIGRYLTKRAENDIATATESLKGVDAFDPQAVLKAQNQVKVAESVLQWLGEAISVGNSALDSLREEQTDG